MLKKLQCKYCKATFYSERIDAKFCSEQHRGKYWRKSRRKIKTPTNIKELTLRVIYLEELVSDLTIKVENLQTDGYDAFDEIEQELNHGTSERPSSNSVNGSARRTRA